MAAGGGAHDRALPARERPREAPADRGAARARGARAGSAPWLGAGRRGRRLVGIGGTVRNLAAAAQRAAGLPSNGVQGALVTREALEEIVQRLAALPGGGARERAGDQAGARGPDPRRRGGRAGGAAGGRLRRRWRSPRRGCARGSSSSATWADARSAAVRGCAPRLACSTSRPATTWTSPTPATWRRSRWGCSTSSRVGLHGARRASGSCCGRRACCTTSGCRWTTTTTTSTRAT